MWLTILIAILFVTVILACLAVLTNPFSRFTVVRLPFLARDQQGSIVLAQQHAVAVRNAWPWRLFAYAKAGVHILETRYIRSARSSSRTVAGIIRDIHKLRYDPSKLLLISGDHFSPLFVRNLGVFYYPMLDNSIRSDKQDWYNRQAVYLQTLAFALDTFRQSKTLTTTIVTTSRRGVTCINFYAYPSDTLYGMLYALASLGGQESGRAYDYGRAEQALATVEAARELKREYGASLAKLYQGYKATVFDDVTGLIRTDVHMSGAKDITRRHSAFYDNVVFWKTTELAMKLGIIDTDKRFLQNLKSKILKTFWLAGEGYFLEDLSDEGIANKYYSSDWLVVLFTGFLDPAKQTERQYFTRSVAYIQRENIDQPFAIKYQNDTRAHRQFLAVRLAVASYGGDAIWSFWGMEYIKLLLKLYQLTGEQHYRKSADYHIAQYKKNMVRDAGFPEVYDKHGALLQTPLYRSIRQTGWVIGFEQVLAIRRTIKL